MILEYCIVKNEVAMLKHQLDELEEHHNQLLQHSPTKVDLSLPPSHISVREHHEESSVTDLITAQMEINQLSSKNERLQAQVKHWKSISQNKQACKRVSWTFMNSSKCYLFYRAMKRVQMKIDCWSFKFNLKYIEVFVAIAKLTKGFIRLCGIS